MLKRNLTLAALALMSLLAESGRGADSGFTISTTPPGAEVTLTGDATVVGITPTTFAHPLFGNYDISVRKFGFERYHSQVTLDPAHPLSLDIRLVPKTRLKAAVRSLFIPGWGQRYTEQKSKGTLFNLLAVGTVAAYLLADDEFRYRRDLYQDARLSYDSSKSVGASSEQMLSEYNKMVETHQKAYDAESTRRKTIGAVIGVWGLSVLDAIFFFPSDYGVYSVGGVSVSPSTNSGMLGLQLSRRF